MRVSRRRPRHSISGSISATSGSTSPVPRAPYASRMDSTKIMLDGRCSPAFSRFAEGSALLANNSRITSDALVRVRQKLRRKAAERLLRGA